MNKYSRKINFSAGPCTLSTEVLESIRDNLLNYNNNGLSVMEMSHRSKPYLQIHKNTIELIKELMGLNDDWTVLLLQGGASLQFDLIPLNFLNGKKGAYVVTGQFSKKAYLAAEYVYGKDKVYKCSDTTDSEYRTVEDPTKWKIDEENTAYIHLTTNNTVYGLKLPKKLPKFNIPIIADMSSNILSEEYDYNQFDMIYAGAQKNLGCAGLTVVAIKNSFLKKAKTIDIPKMLQYKVHADADSEYNTPPSFSIYVAYENLKWVKKQGGVKEFEKRNYKKSDLLYNYIDNSSFYNNYTDKEFRSIMNVIFFTNSKELDTKFAKEAEENNILSIKGYKSLGGLRASIYNGMSFEEVEELIKFMKKFESENK